MRKLALENKHPEVELMLGIFKMDAAYCSKIANTLEDHELQYIPEAHNYLKIGNQYYDFTNPNASYASIAKNILFETSLEYDQINTYKINIHQDFLANWILDIPRLSLEKLWIIRERCIENLQES